MELAPEVHFAQRLACNQSKLSERALRKVGQWFAAKSVNKDGFTEDSLMKLWKGLFYYFWATDKPLVQEEKADIICGYIHVFKTTECSFLYIDTFFQTMAREWMAIDRYRIEKFMMLVRRFLHQTYQLLKHLHWELKWIKRFRKLMKKTVLNGISESTPLGLKMHISDIYMEELAKVGAEELTPEMLRLFLVPYCKILIECDESAFLNSVSKDVFLYLINQDVDEDLFHEFPVLNFDAEAIQNLLMKYANKAGVRTPNMKVVYSIIKQYENYKNGVSITDRMESKGNPKKLRKRDIEKSALNLMQEELSYREDKKKAKKQKTFSDDVIDL